MEGNSMSVRGGLDRLLSEESFYKVVLCLLVGLPVVEFITEVITRLDDRIIPSFFEPQIIALFGILGTLMTVGYFIASFSRKRRLRTCDIFYFTLILFMVISGVFSLNPGVFSGDSPFYCENPLHFLAYYWLFFAGTIIDNDNYRKNILFCFTGVAIFESIFGFLHTFDIELSYSLYYHAERTAYGLTQNSNFYGGLMVFLIAGASGLYIFSDKLVSSKAIKCALPLVSAFLFYTMLGSRARLAWVGFAALTAFYVISLIIMYRKDKEAVKPAIKHFLILWGAYFAVFLIAFIFTDYIREATVRTYWEVANGDADKIGSDRFYNWKMGLMSVPKHWLSGVGLDNYRYVFISDPNYQEGMYLQDKAHNEYIHILVTQGVPSLLNYLALLIFSLIGAVKSVLNEVDSNKRTFTWIFLGMFAAYVVQALFNSSITYVVIYFWFVLGLITPRTEIYRKSK